MQTNVTNATENGWRAGKRADWQARRRRPGAGGRRKRWQDGANAGGCRTARHARSPMDTHGTQPSVRGPEIAAGMARGAHARACVHLNVGRRPRYTLPLSCERCARGPVVRRCSCCAGRGTTSSCRGSRRISRVHLYAHSVPPGTGGLGGEVPQVQPTRRVVLRSGRSVASQIPA